MLQIDDFHQLNALVKVLCSYKFDSEEPDRLQIASSPFVAQVAAAAYDALIESARRNGDAATARGLVEQRPVSTNAFVAGKIREDLKNLLVHWKGLSDQQKQDLIVTLSSPYTMDEKERKGIVSEINTLSSK